MISPEELLALNCVNSEHLRKNHIVGGQIGILLNQIMLNQQSIMLYLLKDSDKLAWTQRQMNEKV